MALLLAVTACSDEFATPQTGIQNPLNQDKGIGQLVLFSSGNTSNSSTRASVIPYMEQEGRFVCKMYYHAKATDTDASDFDVETTPITSWLRVNDNEGNSVYWQKDFDMDGVNTSHQDYLDYGFDSRAQYFYWRNRLDHIFLGYTDYNQLKTNTYGTTQGKLFMYPEYDGAKKTKTGTKEEWEPSSYRILKIESVSKPNPAFSQDEKEDAEANGDTYDIPETIEVLEFKKELEESETRPLNMGLHFPLMTSYDYSDPNGNGTIALSTIQATQTEIWSILTASEEFTPEEKKALKGDLERLGYDDNESTSEGTFRNARWWITYDYTADNAIDADGSVNLAPGSAVIYYQREKQKMEDIIAVAPANTFDLTRGDRTCMAEQPDPLIALTRMKPTGATQEANRVRLYFKHQFSQIQVNLVNAENTAEITADNIVSVELLGVSKKGYVFTNINPNGTQIPPTYDPVVISQYTEEQQKKNPYGTSFNMFVMNDTEKPQTSLKSFNAIAFGQLQAIRITWQEEPTGEFYDDVTAAEENAKHLVTDGNGKKPGEDGYTTKYETGYTPVNVGDVVPPVKHVATYKITVDDRGNSLVNLKSGFRYMYDFELRRGTIAFIRATIDGWRLSDDLNYGTSGTIAPEPAPEP